MSDEDLDTLNHVIDTFHLLGSFKVLDMTSQAVKETCLGCAADVRKIVNAEYKRRNEAICS